MYIKQATDYLLCIIKVVEKMFVLVERRSQANSNPYPQKTKPIIAKI